MNSISIKKLVASSVAAMFLVTGNMNAQSGEATFKQTCAACHSIGKGKLVGPDLKDVHTKRKEEWIIKFVKGSQAFINSGDADAKAIFDEYKMVMPDQNLKDDEIKGIIAYIAEQSGGAVAATETKTPEAAPVKEKPATAELIAKGKAYYEGSNAFKNGGASCISCHNVNYAGLMQGGLLAKDLTNSFGRLGGSAGISGILTAPPFPAMTSAFKNNPLTPEEIDALSAFLQDADKPNTKAAAGADILFVGGFAAFVGIFGLIIVIWNKRKKNHVKKDIYDRQISAIN